MLTHADLSPSFHSHVLIRIWTQFSILVVFESNLLCDASFPQVYKANWLGVCAAAKVIHLDHLPPSFRSVVVKGVEANLVQSLSHPHV